MELVSKGYCCLINEVTPYGDFDILWQNVMGDKWKRPYESDQKVLYNILYDAGRFPNIKMISYTEVIPVESWIASREMLFDCYIEVTPEIKEMIRAHISDRSEDGMYRIMSQSAVMWWKVPDKI